MISKILSISGVYLSVFCTLPVVPISTTSPHPATPYNLGYPPAAMRSPFTLVNVHLKVFLQASYNASTGTMSDALRIAGVLPATDPYTEVPVPVSTAAGAGVFTVSDAGNSIVDWVLIELRDGNTPSTVLGSKSALLQRDGDIVSPDDGISDVQFVSTDVNPEVIPGLVYIAIKHRNHLSLRTPVAQSSETGTVSYDFTTGQNQAYQNAGIPNNAAMAFVNGTISKYCMWSGDANDNGALKYTGAGRDPLPILNKVLAIPPGGDNTLTTVPGYYFEDLNMNSTVKYSGSQRDPILILNNVLSVLPGGDNTLTLLEHL